MVALAMPQAVESSARDKNSAHTERSAIVHIRGFSTLLLFPYQEELNGFYTIFYQVELAGFGPKPAPGYYKSTQNPLSSKFS